MIVIAASLRARPERRDDLLALGTNMLEPSRAEPGCLRYDLHADVTDPDAFLFYEEWASTDAVEAHFATPHFTDFATRVPDLVAAPPDVTIHEVIRTRHH